MSAPVAPREITVSRSLPVLLGSCTTTVPVVPAEEGSQVSAAAPVPTSDVRAVSPLPDAGSELRSCLEDFARVKGIDLIQHEAVLARLDLTPDILPDVPITRLCELTGAVEGQLWKLQVYCKEWYTRLQKKRTIASIQ